MTEGGGETWAGGGAYHQAAGGGAGGVGGQVQLLGGPLVAVLGVEHHAVARELGVGGAPGQDHRGGLQGVHLQVRGSGDGWGGVMERGKTTAGQSDESECQDCCQIKKGIEEEEPSSR